MNDNNEKITSGIFPEYSVNKCIYHLLCRILFVIRLRLNKMNPLPSS